MDIITAKAKAYTRTGLPHSQPTEPLTWQYDIKSLVHRKQVDSTKVCTSRGRRNNLLLVMYTICMCVCIHVCASVDMHICLLLAML